MDACTPCGATRSTPLTTAGDGPITRDDEATGRLLQSILDIVAECDQVESFAGFQISESRTKDGLLLSVRLVPCDSVAGIVAPRVV